MRKIHSKVLAIITSICLIHAADPPYAKSSGLLPERDPIKGLVIQPRPKATDESIPPRPANLDNIEVLIHSSRPTDSDKECKESQCDEGLKLLKQYIDYTERLEPYKTESNDSSLYHTINQLLKRRGKTQYEKLKEKDFVKPLLKLYDGDVINEKAPTGYNETYNSADRISKEDQVEDITTLSKEDLDLLLHNHEVYQTPEVPNPDDHQSLRRNDAGVPAVGQQEHVGEILPPNYHEQRNQFPYPVNTHLNVQRSRLPRRKSYDYGDVGFPSDTYETVKFRRPFAFQPEEAKFGSDLDYPPASAAAEGYDVAYHQREQQQQFRSGRYVRPEASYDQIQSANNDNRYGQYHFGELAGYRHPGRQRGYRDVLQDTTQRQNVWPSARRPRVIFPTDLVTFREPGQDEADWLASDSNLQDLQQDTQDRGMRILLLAIVHRFGIQNCVETLFQMSLTVTDRG